MADKVLRFTAEDSGYGQTIDRMAAKLRSAFSNTGMEDILQEADAKFSNFGDKLKFIRNELKNIKEGNDQERNAAIKTATNENMRSGYNRSNDEVQRDVSKRYEREEKAINRLADSLDKFADKFEEADKNEQKTNEGAVPPKIPRKPTSEDEGSKGNGFGMIGNMFAVGIGTFLGGLLSKAISMVERGINQSVQNARTETELNRYIRYTGQADSRAEATNRANLGITDKEYLEYVSQSIQGGRYNTEKDANMQAMARLRLNRSYGVQADQFAALDRLRNPNQTGSNTTDVRGYDAVRTISEILQRGSRPGGLFDLTKGDFSLANEKIEQVTRILTDQYGRTGITDTKEAINLIMAGRSIGGRFAGNQAGEAFNNLGSAISNPNSPGFRSLFFSLLQRQNPNLSPVELEAQLQQGLTEKNIRAILPSLQGVRSTAMREVIFNSLLGAGHANDAVNLARKGSLEAIINETKSSATDLGKTAEQLQKERQERGEKTVLGSDQIVTRFENAVTSFGSAVTQFISNWIKDPSMGKSIGNNPGPTLHPPVTKNTVLAPSGSGSFSPLYVPSDH